MHISIHSSFMFWMKLLGTFSCISDYYLIRFYMSLTQVYRWPGSLSENFFFQHPSKKDFSSFWTAPMTEPQLQLKQPLAAHDHGRLCSDIQRGISICGQSGCWASPTKLLGRLQSVMKRRAYKLKEYNSRTIDNQPNRNILRPSGIKRGF